MAGLDKSKTYRLEKDAQNAVLKYLKTLDRSFFFKVSLGRFNMVGIADILGCYHGYFVAIEMKSETGAPTKQQVNFLRSVRKAGGCAGVARCIKDVDHILQQGGDDG